MKHEPSDHPIIKVCGMRDAGNIRQAEALGIDMMGFIFWPQSIRYVSVPPAYLPIACKRVGVFVDATTAEIVCRVADFSLDAVQLHGHESPDAIRALRSMLVQTSPKPRTPLIIKAFNIATPADLEQTTAYEQLADYFLFDAKGKTAGGNGKKFQWNVLQAYHGTTPFLLSGGIGPDDARIIQSFHHPKCIGFDLNSCFESSPGLKHIPSLSHFLQELRHANAND